MTHLCKGSHSIQVSNKRAVQPRVVTCPYLKNILFAAVKHTLDFIGPPAISMGETRT